MKYAYRNYNPIIKCYQPIWFDQEDPDTKRLHVKQVILLFPQKAKEQELEMTVIQYVGKFDEETGYLDFVNPDQSADVEIDCVDMFRQAEALKNHAD